MGEGRPVPGDGDRPPPMDIPSGSPPPGLTWARLSDTGRGSPIWGLEGLPTLWAASCCPFSWKERKRRGCILTPMTPSHSATPQPQPPQGHRRTNRGHSHHVGADQFPDAGTSSAEASLMPLGLPKATWASKHLAGLWARVRLVGGMGRTQGCPQLRASRGWRRARQPPKWLCTQARGGHGAQRVGSLGLSRRSR